MSDMNLSLLIQAKDQATQTLAHVQKWLSSTIKAFGKFGLMAKASLAVAWVAMVWWAKQTDNARSEIIKLTGANEDMTRDMMYMATRINATVPQSLGNIATALWEVNTRMDLTGDELESTSKLFLDFARITGTDVSTAVRWVSRMMRDAGIDIQYTSDVLDMITVAGQKTWVSFSQLSETVVNYGVQMRALWFTLVESTALISQFEKEGVSTQKMMSWLSIALANMARAGITDTATAFRMLTWEIEATWEIWEAVGKALELFGSRAWPDMALALQEWRFNIEELTASLMDSQGALQHTAEASLTVSEKTKMLADQLRGNLQPAIDAVVVTWNWLLQWIIWIINAVGKVARWFKLMGQAIRYYFVVQIENAINQVNALSSAINNLTGVNLWQIRNLRNNVEALGHSFWPQSFNVEGVSTNLARFNDLIGNTQSNFLGLSDTARDVGGSMDDVLWDWGVSGGSWRTTQALKETEYVTEAMIASHNEAKRVVEARLDAVKEENKVVSQDLRRAYNSVNGMIREWEESIKRLSTEILGLQQEIENVTRWANTSVAQEVARLEKQMSGLDKEIHNVMMWGHWDLANLLQQKNEIEREIQMWLQHTTTEELERARMIASETSIERILRERDERISAIKTEIEERQEQITLEMSAIDKLSQFKENAEETYLRLFRSSVQEQLTLYDRLISKAEQLRDVSMWGGVLQQPLNTQNSNTTTQNISINMWGVSVSNEADEDRLVNKIKQVLSRETRDFNSFGVLY